MLKRLFFSFFAAFSVLSVSFAAYAANDNFVFIRQYNDEFSKDVHQSDWYHPYVEALYNLNLSNGYDGFFMPEKNLTIAEAVTMAARLHSIYYNQSAEYADSYITGGAWYDTYMAYAKDNGIIDERFDSQPESVALRKYAAYIFSSVFDMDDENSLYAGDIPDLNDEEYSYYIVKACNKGLMNGVDEQLSFSPDEPLRRCEAAAVAVRCALPEIRISIKVYDPIAAMPQAQYSDRIITVTVPNGSKGTLCLYAKTDNNRWNRIMDVPCTVGRNGLYKTREGDGKTPCGSFNLGTAFGILDNPGAGIGYIKVDENYYWVDDPNSVYYNKLVNINEVSRDWQSAEHLIDIAPEYYYAVDTGYNSECNPGKGSAIFIHCYAGSATGGCIAIDTDSMITLLQNVTENTSVVIGD